MVDLDPQGFGRQHHNISDTPPGKDRWRNPRMYWFIMAPKTNPPFGGGNRHLLSQRCNTLLGGGVKYC